MTTLEPGARPPRTTFGDDLEHLRLLSIFHYVVAGIAALVSLLPGIQLVIGLAMATGNLDAQEEGARIVGSMMAGCAAFLIAIGLTFAAMVALAGRSLAQRRRYTFCLVVAALLCLFVPFGTLLGVFTIVVLVRTSVRVMFEGGGAARPVASTA